MESKFNKTMLAVPYIIGFQLGDPISKQLIANYTELATGLTDKINQATGGMFTHNVRTRMHYFTHIIEKNISNFDQLLVLSIGLDTKFDTLKTLKDKSVFAIDIEVENIHKIYKDTNLKTNVTTVYGNLSNIENDVIDNLIANGFDTTKKTFIVWEGGTFYIEKSKVLSSILFLKS